MNDAFERAAEKADAEYGRQRRERRARARRKVFRSHATVFVAVQALLIVVWLLDWLLEGSSYPWFLYALFGWGVGLAAHYAAVRESLRRLKAARPPA